MTCLTCEIYRDNVKKNCKKANEEGCSKCFAFVFWDKNEYSWYCECFCDGNIVGCPNHQPKFEVKK